MESEPDSMIPIPTLCVCVYVFVCVCGWAFVSVCLGGGVNGVDGGLVFSIISLIRHLGV